MIDQLNLRSLIAVLAYKLFKVNIRKNGRKFYIFLTMSFL